MKRFAKLGDGRKDLALLGLLILVAAFLRLYRLNDVPPGLYHDEAFNGLDAIRILQAGWYPLFFEGNGGREPLFIYLEAISIKMLGASPFALRIVSALVGLSTIPMLYVLTKLMFASVGSEEARRIALLAATGLTTSYWHVHFSRIGFRTILLPLFIVMTLWLFWQGWFTGKKGFFVEAGVLLGISAYTYIAARLLPLVLLAFIFWECLKGGWATLKRRGNQLSAITSIGDSNQPALQVPRFSDRLNGVLLLTLVSLAFFAPLGCYFQTHPFAWSGRVKDVSIWVISSEYREVALATLSNLGKVLRMFVDQGDWQWRHNLPCRPALNIVSSIGFWTGIAMAICRLNRPQYGLTLLWVGVMLSAMVFSTDAPNTLRSLGAAPAVYILSAIGLSILWAKLTSWMGWPTLKWLPGLIVALLGLGGLRTYHDYFNVWAAQAETYYAFDADKVALARRVIQQGQNHTVYLPVEMYAYPTVTYLLSQVYTDAVSLSTADDPMSLISGKERAVCFLPPDSEVGYSFILLDRPSQSKGTAYILSPLDHSRREMLIERVHQGATLELRDSNDMLIAYEWPLSSPADFFSPDVIPPYSLEADFGGQLRLVGYNLAPYAVMRGSEIRLDLYWEAVSKMNKNYEVFVHLLDSKGQVRGQADVQPLQGAYPTVLWRPGEIVPDQYKIKVGPRAIPGKYTFEVGLYQKTTGQRLPVIVDAESGLLDNKITLETVKVIGEPIDVGSIRFPMQVSLGDKIIFRGYDLASRALKPGDTINLTLYWQARKKIDKDYTVFTHLLGPDGRIEAQHDDQPQSGRYPTSIWDVGENVKDEHRLVIGLDVPSGSYELKVGLYQFATGERLPVYDPSGVRLVDDAISLETLTVNRN